MKINRLIVLIAAFVLALALSLENARAAEDEKKQDDDARRLFAAEIKMGPAWEQGKPPHEQRYFREHSENLKRLRDEGRLVMGARYSDKGLVVLQATSIEEARTWMQQDPAIQHGVLTCEIHPFNVFYPGTLERKR